MGQCLSSLFGALFYYPIVPRPVCYALPEDVTSIGTQLVRSTEIVIENSEYNQLVVLFQDGLRSLAKEQTRFGEDLQDKDDVDQYPGWNEMTLLTLRNLFQLFDNDQSSFINLEEFCSILALIGDTSPFHVRRRKFLVADTKRTGLIDYDDFVKVLYNFSTPPDGEVLCDLAKLCYDLGENVRFLSDLSVGELFEYGLF